MGSVNSQTSLVEKVFEQDLLFLHPSVPEYLLRRFGSFLAPSNAIQYTMWTGVYFSCLNDLWSDVSQAGNLVYVLMVHESMPDETCRFLRSPRFNSYRKDVSGNAGFLLVGCLQIAMIGYCLCRRMYRGIMPVVYWWHVGNRFC